MSMHRAPLSLLGATTVILALAACSSSSGSSSSPSAGGASAQQGSSSLKGKPVIIGTTDTVTSLDPAGAYDEGSWTLMYNMYQTLVTIPAGGNKPVGDAAKSCTYTNPKTLKCTIRPGEKFSNGDPLNAAAVKYSIVRNMTINDPKGASILLDALTTGTDKKGKYKWNPDKAIQTPNKTTVIFHLAKPDSVFISALTTPAGAIVDPKVFPADKKLSASKLPVGSGPYELVKYTNKQIADFKANPHYAGPFKPQAPEVLVQYFTDSSALKLAVQNGTVNVAWRSLAPEDLKSLAKNPKLTVGTGPGSEIRYWVWKVNGPIGKNLAIRKAAAYLINRQQIAKVAYDNTVKPLYSIVPPGFAGQTAAFKKAYGATPNKAKAVATLEAAGVKTPIHLTVGYTPSHYGPNAIDEATQVQRQLDASGLFKVKLKSAEWTTYQSNYQQGAYDMYMLGWFPDYLDADDYLAPFLVDGGFYKNGYHNATVNKLVASEEATSDSAKRAKIFEKLQTIAAKDVPFIPTWVGKNTAVYAKGIKGVKKTLDPSFIFRFWDVTNGS